jgi:hypothetical protein
MMNLSWRTSLLVLAEHYRDQFLNAGIEAIIGDHSIPQSQISGPIRRLAARPED